MNLFSRMIYKNLEGFEMKPNPPDNVTVAYIVIFLSVIILLYTSYIKSLNINIDIVNFYRLLSVNLKNYNEKKIRDIETFNELQSRYVKKFLNLKSIGAFEPICSNNKTFISHNFFRILEYSVAESIINMAYIISQHQGDKYIENIYKIKIESFIKEYSKIYKYDKNCLISLNFKILQNVCYIKNINSLDIINTIEYIFTRRFNVSLSDLIVHIPPEQDFNIFKNELNYWSPDTMIRLKYLTKLNLTFLNF